MSSALRCHIRDRRGRRESLRHDGTNIGYELAFHVCPACPPGITVLHELLSQALAGVSDRLADAIGPENAQAILQHADSTYPTAQKIANRTKWIGVAAKAVGLGGAGGLDTRMCEACMGCWAVWSSLAHRRSAGHMELLDLRDQLQSNPS
jgi:hypothetical protein